MPQVQAMKESPHPKTEPDQPAIYEIRIGAELGPEWMDWFEKMAVSVEEAGVTVIVGAVADQAALFGLLKKVRDLGIPLISINPVRSQPEKE